ncbi:Cap [Molossus molossus associated gemycircularvirus 3]|nr:Cap [Molossus molossus associated gemycircularvirus 3]
MAYRYARKRGQRASGMSKRKTARSYRRRYTAKKRTYRKKGAMSKKRILNTTSRKKRDTMLTYSNTSATGASQATAAGPAFVSATTGGIFLWQATARDLTAGSTLATISNESARTSTNTYMRGLSEHVRIQTSSGLPWFHRRVCFTAKGDDPWRLSFSGDSGTPYTYVESTNGFGRLMFNISVNSTPNYTNQIYSVIFKGAQGVDWNDAIIAPIDTRRITLKFDQTWTMQSGNTQGVVRERKLWHPMNKSLLYDDDESGIGETTSYDSVTSKPGMGDYYVLDIFSAGTGGTSTDLLRIDATSTLYWHEK